MQREKKTLSDAVQRPAAAKCDDSQPGGSGPEPAYRGTPAPTPPQAAVWNPFKSKARVPQTPEAEQSEEEVVGDGRQGQGAVKQGRPLVAVPSDQEILTSLPPDKIWDKMQQHASEGIGPPPCLAPPPPCSLMFTTLANTCCCLVMSREDFR